MLSLSRQCADATSDNSLPLQQTAAPIVKDKADNDELRGLLQAAATGDRRAFEALYLHTSWPLYRILLRMLKVEAIAQEALQEVFIKIWQRADHYDPDLSVPMAWMSRIARNQAIDTMRYQQIRVDLELDNGERLLEQLVDASPGQRPDDFDSALPLLHCLEQLAPTPRSCVVRAFCEGYSQEELSAQTGAPIGTVKSWIRRSLSALRRCLDQFHE